MNAPRPRPRARIYRSAEFYRRRRRRAIVLPAVVALALVAGAVVMVTWSWGDGDRGTAARQDQTAAVTPAPSPTKATQAQSAAPSPSPPALIEIGWVGDTTPGSMYGNPPDNGRALFAHVRDQLRKPDLMIANLEGTYSSGGTSKCAGSDSGLCFAFQAPPSFAKALPWAGIDFVNLANNHTNDYFQSGLDQTVAALEKNDVAYTGLPDQITVVDVEGVKVAAVGFSPYPWNANINDIPAARALVKKAAGKADVVVVLMHVGAEGSDKTHTPHGNEYAFGENRGDPRAFAHAVVDVGADLVLGSGPHVIRGIERYRTRLIAYSLGNFGGWGNFGTGGTLSLSGLLTVKVDAGGHVKSGRWLSVRLDEPGVPVLDSSHESARLVDQLSRTDFSNTFRIDATGHVKAR